ncbi:MAG: DinB family protein [Gemmatimonadaceae bacterium]
MFTDIVQTLVVRELRALRRNIELYPDDASIWALPPGISNSAGTLALHLTGNIQNYIGRRLGGTAYVRDRPAEFSRRDVSRDELLRDIDAAIDSATNALSNFDESALWNMFPEQIGGRSFSTGHTLAHLAVHLGYHLGQVDYHRRIVTGSNQGANALSLLEMLEFQST